MIPALANKQGTPNKQSVIERLEEKKTDEIVGLRTREFDGTDELQKSGSEVNTFAEPLLAVFPDESVQKLFSPSWQVKE